MSARAGVLSGFLLRRRALVAVATSGLCASLLVAPSFPPAVAHASPGHPPVGPAAAVQAQPSVLVPSANGDIAALRTAVTQTFRKGDGRFEEDLYATPVNYQASDKTWQPISTKLVTSGTRKHATSAGDVVTTLPDDLSSAPVTVTGGGTSVGIQLVGAASVTGAVAGSTETWAAALPGVDVALTDASRGVKESLTLRTAAATSVFAYTLTVPSGAAVNLTSAGAVAVRVGGAIVTLPAAFMDDASHTRVGHSTDVPYSLAQVNASTWTVTMTPSHSWLTDPARVFPVVIDPTVFINFGTGYLGCGLVASTPTTSHCTDTTFGVGANSGNYRGVAYFPNLQNTIPLDSQVTEGDFFPVATSALNGTTQSLSVYPITGANTPTAGATWNTYDGTHAWTTAGGDFSPTAAGTASLPPGTGARQTINITNLVQDWLTGARANHGLLIKATTEPGGNLDFFGSSGTANAPELKVTYQARFGSKATSSFTARTVTDRQVLKVNNVNGNLVIDATDLNIAAPAMTTSVAHTFNSQRNTVRSTLGFGWSFDTGRDVRAVLDTGSGDIFFTAPGGNLFIYRPKTGGGYTEAPGSGATATYGTPPGGGATTVIITRHKPYETDVFDPTSGVLTSRTDEDGNKQTFTYGSTFTGDGAPYLTSSTDTAGRVVTFNHPGFFESGVSDGTGRSVGYAFGGTGGSTSDLTSFTDATGSTGATAYQYDANDRVTQIKPPKDASSGAHYTITYDSVGRVTGLADPGGSCSGTVTKCTTFAYTNIAAAGGTGQTVVTDPLGHATTYTWDNRDRITKVSDALGHSRSKTYNDLWDAPATQTDAQSPANTTSFGQDAIGNSTTSTAPAEGGTTGRVNTLGYAAPGGNAGDYNATSVSHSDGTTTTNLTGYPATGHLQKSAQGSAAADITYTYQSISTGSCTGAHKGQLCTATDGNGNTTSYAYSGSPKYQLTTVTPPAPAVATAYTYDTSGRVLTSKQGTGPKTTYTYDADDRVKEVQYNGITTCTSADINARNCVTFGYDGNGNLTSRVDVTGTTSFGYTDLNQPSSKNIPGSATPSSAIYDNAGNIFSYNDAGGTVTYTYNTANQLVALAEPGGSCSSYPAVSGGVTVPNSHRCTGFSVDNNGNRLQTAYPSGEKVNVNYGNDHRVAGISADVNGSTTPFWSRTLSYTSGGGLDSGLVQSWTENASITSTFTYDDHNRLTSDVDGTTTYSYTFDAAGNRTSYNPAGSGFPASYTGYNNADQECWAGTTAPSGGVGTDTGGASCAALTVPPGDGAVVSDANGNFTSYAGAFTSTYDTANRTTSTTRGGTTVNFTYAGLGQSERTAAGSTSIVNGLEGIAAQTTAGASLYFTRDPQGTLISMRQGSGGTSTNSYYLLDQQGSVIAMTAADGTTQVAGYFYDPYGVVYGTSGSLFATNPFWFAGAYYDINSEEYKLGARYLGGTGFTQVDPSGQDAPYAYAGDNPINNTDPNGLSFLGDVADALGYAAKAHDVGSLLNGFLDASREEVQGAIVGAAAGYVVEAACTSALAVIAAPTAETALAVGEIGCIAAGQVVGNGVEHDVATRNEG